MPYQAIDELPAKVKKQFPSQKEQRAFLAAFNSSFEACAEEDRPAKSCEKQAFASATTAAQGVKSMTTETKEYGYAELLSPVEANYNALGASDTQGCANCRWFLSPNKCQVVFGDIAPTGLSDLYMPNPNIPIAEIEIMVGQIGKMKTKRWQPLTDYFLRKFKKKKLPIEEQTQGFKVVGDNRWVAWFTNAFEDRDGEIFSTDALKRYVVKAQETGKFPRLDFFHMGKKTTHGQADMVTLADRFVIATGTFDDTPLAMRLKTHYSNNTMGVSHGFEYDPSDLREDVYHDFFTFEISPLPLGSEANPYTAFIKGAKQMLNFTEEQKNAFAAIAGEDIAQKLFAEAQQKTQTLEGNDVNYKAKNPFAKEDEDDDEKKEEKAEDEEGKEDMKKALAAISSHMNQVTQVLTGFAEQMKAQNERLTTMETKAAASPSPASVQGSMPDLNNLVNDMNTNRSKQVDTRDLDYGGQQLLQSFGGKAFGLEE